MKKLTKKLIIILILSVSVRAADTELQDLVELTAVLGTDVLYVVDDPGGTPLSKKITATNLFDLIDTFAELNTITADKTLVNEEDAVAWDALGTFNLGITITTGDPFTLGVIRWDNGSDLMDGEQIAADTIDNDSIDWGDMTDLTTDGAVVWGNITAGELADDTVNDDDINWADLTYLTTNGAAIDEAFAAGWNGDVGPAEKDDIYDILHAYDTDDDGDIDTVDGGIAALLYETELDTFAELDTQIADKSLINLADGGTFTGGLIANANLSVGNATTTAGVLTLLEDDDDGANFASFMVPALGANTVYTLPPDDGDNTEVLQTDGSGVLTWVANAGGGTSFFAEDGDTTEVEIDDAKEWKFVEGASIDIDWTDTSTGSDADPFDLTIKLVVADDESTDDDHEIVFTTDNATLESDGDFHYSPDTGTVTATEFVGGGAGLTSVDAITGDSATAFFDAGTIEHEYGGLEADINAYTGLVAITGGSTAEVDSKSELEGHIADVADFAEADGDVFTGDHNFGGADLELPQGQTPDTDGDIDLDFTDGSVVIQHGSAHAELGAATDVVVGKLIHSFAATIFAPDGVNDVIPLKMIDDLEFPHGVVIVECLLQVGTDSNYTLTLQNYDDFDTINAGDGTIDAVAYTAGNDGEVTDTSITYGTIGAGQIIMMSIPSTDVDWIHIEVFYYEPIA